MVTILNYTRWHGFFFSFRWSEIVEVWRCGQNVDDRQPLVGLSRKCLRKH